MAAIYSNGGSRWNILGFNLTKRDALSSVYKISMARWQRGKEFKSFTFSGLTHPTFRLPSSLFVLSPDDL